MIAPAVRLLLALACVLSLAAPSFALDQGEKDKVDYLLKCLGDQKDAVFIRNGDEYDSAKAVEHLRMKLNHEIDKIATAQDFIDKIAAKSSTSGKDYQLKFKDGTTVKSADFLNDKLKEYKKPESPKAEAPVAKP